MLPPLSSETPSGTAELCDQEAAVAAIQEAEPIIARFYVHLRPDLAVNNHVVTEELGQTGRAIAVIRFWRVTLSAVRIAEQTEEIPEIRKTDSRLLHR